MDACPYLWMDGPGFTGSRGRLGYMRMVRVYLLICGL